MCAVKWRVAISHFCSDLKSIKKRIKPIKDIIQLPIIEITFLLDLQIDVVSTKTPKIIAKYLGIFE